jgi:acetate---CoA ligase (ADP-forming)
MSKGTWTSSLEPLMRPKSIVIFGVSGDLSKLSGMPLRHLINHRFSGKIFPINAKYDEIGGYKCYPDILSIPESEEIDLALVVLPAKNVHETLQKCIQRGIKAAIVYSSGFAEIGGKGIELQQQIRELVWDNHLLLCGPNTDGIGIPHEQIPLGFATSMELLPPGNIGLVTHSGAVMNSIVYRCWDRGMGFTYHVCAGNEAHLESSDYIKYMLDDPKTKVILAFIEGFKDTKKFLAVADYAMEKQKPIVVLKVGKSEKGSKAAASHTGALTGSDQVYDAVFKQKGVIRADDFDDLAATALLFQKCALPKGTGVGVISVSGGAMGVMADKAAELGVDLPDLAPHTQEELQRIFHWAKPTNPFDLTGQMASDPTLLSKVLNLFLEDENIAFLIVTVTPFPSFFDEKFFLDIVEASKNSPKPMAVCTIRGTLREQYAKVLTQAELPILYTPDESFRAIKALIAYSQYQERYCTRAKDISRIKSNKGTPEIEEMRRELMSTNEIFTERQTKNILSRYDIPVTKEALAKTTKAAIEQARNIGYPVVLKIESPQIIHKSDAGCIKLNISTDEELASAFNEVIINAQKYNPAADIAGVLVQEMVPDGLEVIMGISRDPQFGLTIMFGLGGIFVEVLEDISLRLVPITRRDAEEMIKEIKGYKILQGVRGQPPRDIDALVDTLLKVSRLAQDMEDKISEMDLNPIIVFGTGKGIKVVDSLMILNRDLKL